MTDDMQRVLELVADMAAAIRRAGSEQDGNWGYPASSAEFARIEKEAREAARSASGAEHMQWCSYAQDKTADCDCSAVTAAPAPAEATARECRHVLDSSSGDQRCIRCDQPVLLPRLPETPEPVPTPGGRAEGAAEAGLTTRAVDAAPIGEGRLGRDASQSEAPSPVPTPPDAAQGKPHSWVEIALGWQCRHCKALSSIENQTLPTYGCTRPTTTGESGLRECPFCSGQMIVRERSAFHPENECFLSGIGTLELDEHDYAAWNTRSTPRAREGDARETWAFIERVLVEECGLLADQGLSSQRENFISAITNLAGDELLKAASDFLAVPSLARVRVAGRMMSREDVSAAIAGRRVGTEGDAWAEAIEAAAHWHDAQSVEHTAHNGAGGSEWDKQMDQRDAVMHQYYARQIRALTRLHSTATQADGEKR